MAVALPLPIRHGVTPSCVSLPLGSWPTVLAFLVQRFPAISASAWVQRMASGEVVNEQGQALTPAQPYQPHGKLYYYRSLAQAEPRIPFEAVVLYQDAHLVVADKPHFLPVTPSGGYLHETLLVRLRLQLGLEDLAPLHRIDRETAGLVLLSAQRASRGAYHQLFAQRSMKKTYQAVVHWQAGRALPADYQSRLQDGAHFMQMQEVAGPANAHTRLQLLAVHGRLATLGLTPVTGRRHQLRVHCAALGVPIVNDPIYPQLLPEQRPDYEQPLQLLAQSIAFVDPLTGESRCFESRQRLALATQA